MNLLRHVKKEHPMQDDSFLEQSRINTRPQSEPVKRINRGIIFVVGIVFMLACAFGLYSCDGLSSKKQPEVTNSAKNAIITDENLKSLEGKAAAAKKDKSEVPAAANNHSVSGGKGIYNESRSASPQGRSVPVNSGSASVSSGSSVSQPSPITPYEKYKEDSQNAYYKRQLSNEERMAADKQKAQASSIFFNLNSPGETMERNNKAQPVKPENSNDGYIEILNPSVSEKRW